MVRLLIAIVLCCCSIALLAGRSMAQSAAPAFGTADAECDCSANLYTCQDFPTWSAAQACFNRCRILVGFDIHELDENRNGIACELAYPDFDELNGLDVEDFMPIEPALDASELFTEPHSEITPTQTFGEVEEAPDAIAPGLATPDAESGEQESAPPTTEPTATPNLSPPAAQAPGNDPSTMTLFATLLPMALVGAVVLVAVLVVGGLIGLWIARRLSPKS